MQANSPDQAAADSSNKKKSSGRRRQASKLRAAKDAMYREHIMEVAERMFAEHGFGNAKMTDIARAAGISLGTLYQSYSGKSELYRQLLIVRDGQMFDAVMARGQTMLQQPRSVEQLLWLMEGHVGYLLEHHHYLRILLQEGYAWYHSAAQPSSDEQRMWQQGMAMIERMLEWGVEQGLFVPGEAGHRARLLIAMQQTQLASWVMDGMQEPHAAVVARIQADFVRQFCRPEVAAEMLSADGAELTEATVERIRALDQPPPA